MKILVTLTAFCCLLVLPAIPARAQKPAVPKAAEVKAKSDSSEYPRLVEKAKKGDASVDFVKLRAAFLDWINDECNQTDAPNRDVMEKAFDAKDYAKAAELVEAVLDYEFVNRGLHLAAADAYKETKNVEKEKFHNDIAQKLLKAMLDSGDGKTAKTAFKVHSIREEYIIMRELGYQVSMQSLVMDKDYGSFDVLAGNGKDGKGGSFYFDINSFFGLGKGSKPCKKDGAQKPAAKP